MKALNVSNDTIALFTGIHISTVRRIVKEFDLTGDYGANPPKKPGKRHKISEEDVKVALNCLLASTCADTL
jgi:transposase